MFPAREAINLAKGNHQFLIRKGLKGSGYKAGKLRNNICLRNEFKGNLLIKAATWRYESG